MKGSKKCKKNDCQKDKQNSMNEAQLESVQGGLGIPANWKPSDGARMKQHTLPMFDLVKFDRVKNKAPIMTLEERND